MFAIRCVAFSRGLRQRAWHSVQLYFAVGWGGVGAVEYAWLALWQLNASLLVALLLAKVPSISYDKVGMGVKVGE